MTTKGTTTMSTTTEQSGREVAYRYGNGTVETYVDELNDQARSQWERGEDRWPRGRGTN